MSLAQRATTLCPWLHHLHLFLRNRSMHMPPVYVHILPCHLVLATRPANARNTAGPAQTCAAPARYAPASAGPWPAPGDSDDSCPVPWPDPHNVVPPRSSQRKSRPLPPVPTNAGKPSTSHHTAEPCASP